MSEKESLKGRIEAARKRLVEGAGGAMEGLAQVATSLQMAELNKRLKEVHGRLLSETFRLIMLGRFKNGKSTMMNALLGKVTQAVSDLPPNTGPMPVDDLPCTATLTSICYAARPYVKVWKMDGQNEMWSLKRYLAEATVKSDDAETQKFFENIREFEVGFPADLCQSGVTLLDSPGLDDVPQRSAITREAVGQCDAAIVVYRHEPLAGEGEREFVSRTVAGTGTRVFTLVNLYNGRKVDERLKGFTWNRLVKEMQGEAPYAGQDLASKDIFFIDAKMAMEGKLSGDQSLIEASGLGPFERRLGEFLVRDRQRTHVERWVRVASDTAGLMDQQISQRRKGLEQDQARLQAAYDKIKPELEAIHQRKAKLPALFERYLRECQRELRSSFQEMVNQVRQDLPDHLARTPLPTMKTATGMVFSSFQQGALCKEALTVCNAFITERVKAWTNNPPEKPGAQRSLAPILQRFTEDIRDEVARIDRAFAQMQLQLTGWAPQTGGPSTVISMQERVLAGVAGLFVGDFASLFGAGGGGWRAVVGNLAGQLAVGIGMFALGLAGSLVFLPAVLAAGILGSLLGGGWGLEERIKRSVLLAVDQGTDGSGGKVKDEKGNEVRGLVHAAADAAPKIDSACASLFKALEEDVMQKVNAEVEGEESNIRKIMEDNKRDAADKARLVAELDQATMKIEAHRKALKQAALEAKVAMP